mmetsp:Transcript_3839/g.11741  ORF Transcript_3839/g.11741 Transcript_3839/m.11741 type:complete len:331 (-) Transcript_3839:2-994(-)
MFGKGVQAADLCGVVGHVALRSVECIVPRAFGTVAVDPISDQFRVRLQGRTDHRLRRLERGVQRRQSVAVRRGASGPGRAVRRALRLDARRGPFFNRHGAAVLRGGRSRLVWRVVEVVVMLEPTRQSRILVGVLEERSTRNLQASRIQRPRAIDRGRQAEREPGQVFKVVEGWRSCVADLGEADDGRFHQKSDLIQHELAGFRKVVEIENKRHFRRNVHAGDGRDRGEELERVDDVVLVGVEDVEERAERVLCVGVGLDADAGAQNVANDRKLRRRQPPTVGVQVKGLPQLQHRTMRQVHKGPARRQDRALAALLPHSHAGVTRCGRPLT